MEFNKAIDQFESFIGYVGACKFLEDRLNERSMDVDYSIIKRYQSYDYYKNIMKIIEENTNDIEEKILAFNKTFA